MGFPPEDCVRKLLIISPVFRLLAAKWQPDTYVSIRSSTLKISDEDLDLWQPSSLVVSKTSYASRSIRFQRLAEWPIFKEKLSPHVAKTLGFR